MAIVVDRCRACSRPARWSAASSAGSSSGPVNAVLGWFFRLFNRLFDRVTAIYGEVVGGLLRISALALLVYGGLLVVTWWQFNRTPTGFVPQQDKGYLLLNVQLPDSASVERTASNDGPHRRCRRPRTPGVAHTVGISGQSLILNANAPNLGSMYVMLKPFDERRGAELYGRRHCRRFAAALPRRSQRSHRRGLRRAADRRPGHHRRLQNDRRRPRQPRPGRNCSVSAIRSSPAATARRACKACSTAPAPTRRGCIWKSTAPSAMALGVSVSDVFNTLQVYLGSYYVNNFNEFGRTWQVNVQADPQFRDQVPDVRQLQVRNNQGQMVRLATLMDVRDTSGPVMVMRYNLYSAAAITGERRAGHQFRPGRRR